MWLDEEDDSSVVKATVLMFFKLTETDANSEALELTFSGLELNATFQNSGSYFSRTIVSVCNQPHNEGGDEPPSAWA